MAEKSKEQLKVEEYFKQNGIEYDKNFIYGIKRERNLNSFLMMGLIGLIMKAGMKPCYILFKENEILFFEVGMAIHWFRWKKVICDSFLPKIGKAGFIR